MNATVSYAFGKLLPITELTVFKHPLQSDLLLEELSKQFPKAPKMALIDLLHSSQDVVRGVFIPLLETANLEELEQIFQDKFNQYFQFRFFVSQFFLHFSEDNLLALIPETIEDIELELASKEKNSQAFLKVNKYSIKLYKYYLNNLSLEKFEKLNHLDEDSNELKKFTQMVGCITAFELCILPQILDYENEAHHTKAEVLKCLSNRGKEFILQAIQLAKALGIFETPEADSNIEVSSSEDTKFLEAAFQYSLEALRKSSK